MKPKLHKRPDGLWICGHLNSGYEFLGVTAEQAYTRWKENQADKLDFETWLESYKPVRWTSTFVER